MIPLNPDSDKWVVTFCFWTLKYRDIGLFIIMPYYMYGIYYGLYEGPCPIWQSLTNVHLYFASYIQAAAARNVQFYGLNRTACTTTFAACRGRMLF
jgi:hypothetical protein